MRIRSLSVHNLGVLMDQTIRFDPPHDSTKAEIHILTGQNGSGKSTILLTLADAFARDGALKKEIRRRFRTNEHHGIYAELTLDDNTVVHQSATTVEQTEEWNGSWDESAPNQFGRYITRNGQTAGPITFAVFAYSGFRRIDDEPVQANLIRADFDPLSNSLQLTPKESNSEDPSINQLIANSISNRALAREEGAIAEAERHNEVITVLEAIIQEVTGWNVKFVLKRSPSRLLLRMQETELDLAALPDGLRSIVSWIADLLFRLDLLSWVPNVPLTKRNLILLLDEVEVHLHPIWQRNLLPVLQKTFPNAQVFVSTHSPFVVNSVDGAWVHKFEFENGRVRVLDAVQTEDSDSITQVLREVFEVNQWFGVGVQKRLDRFQDLKRRLLENGDDDVAERELVETARSLADEPNDQLKQMVRRSLMELEARKGRHFSL